MDDLGGGQGGQPEPAGSERELKYYVEFVAAATGIVATFLGWSGFNTIAKKILVISAAVLLVALVVVVRRWRGHRRRQAAARTILSVLLGAVGAFTVAVFTPETIVAWSGSDFSAMTTTPVPARIVCDLGLARQQLAGDYKCLGGAMNVAANPDHSQNLGFWLGNTSGWEIPTGWTVTFTLSHGLAPMTVTGPGGFESAQPGNDAISTVHIEATVPGTMILRPCHPCLSPEEFAQKLTIAVTPTPRQ